MKGAHRVGGKVSYLYNVKKQGNAGREVGHGKAWNLGAVFLALPGARGIRSPLVGQAKKEAEDPQKGQQRLAALKTKLIHWIQEANGLVRQRQYSRAISLYQKILRYVAKLPPAAQGLRIILEAGTHMKLGGVYLKLRQYELAHRHLGTGIRIFEMQPNPSPRYLALAYNNLGEAYFQLGRMKKALQAFQKSKKLGELRGFPTPSDQAMLHFNLGKLYLTLGQFSRAKSFLLLALKQQRTFLKSPHPHLAMTYHHLGVVEENCNRPREAEQYYLQSLEQYQQMKDWRSYGRCGSDYAVLLATTGRYTQAMTLLEKIQKLYQKHLDSNSLDWYHLYYSYGVMFLLLWRSKEAEKMFHKALKIARKFYAPSHPAIAQCYSGLARAYHQQYQLKAALLYYNKAYSLFRKIYPYPHPQRALMKLMIAEVLGYVGKSRQIYPLLEDVRKEMELLYQPPHERLLKLAHFFSITLWRLGKYREAEQWARQALAQAPKILSRMHFGFGFLHQDLAEALWGQQRYHEAWIEANKSWQLQKKLFELKQPFLSLSEQVFLLDAHLWPTLSLTVELALRNQNRDWTRQAFHLTLYWKGWIFRTLLEQKRRKTLLYNLGLRELEKQYQQAIHRAQYLAYRPSPLDPKARQMAEKQLEEALRRVAELEHKIYGKLLPRLEFPKTLPNLRKLLPNQAATLEYVVTMHPKARQRWVHLFLVTSQNIQLWRLASERKVAKSIQQLETLLQKARDLATQDPAQLQQNQRQLARASHQLYQLLFPAELHQKLAGKKLLLIAPDGVLYRLSFAMLVTQFQPSLRYLVEDYDLVYLFSASSLTESKQLKKQGQGFLGLAHPTYAGPPWVPLPQTRQELKDAAHWYRFAFPEQPQQLFTESQATKQVFVRHSPGKRWIHLATHGFFYRPEQPEKPAGSRRSLLEWVGVQENPLLLAGLVLAAPPGREADQYLTAWEISQLDLQAAECVVLSACETAQGQYLPDGGLWGFRWAFGQAGVRFLVSSLWRVGDREALVWMNRFYQRLHLGPWRALLATQRSFLKDPTTRHPIYWASFIVQGNPLPLPSSKTKVQPSQPKVLSSPSQKPWVWLIIATLALGLALLGGIGLYLRRLQK